MFGGCLDINIEHAIKCVSNLLIVDICTYYVKPAELAAIGYQKSVVSLFHNASSVGFAG
jgi:hypothetical protein